MKVLTGGVAYHMKIIVGETDCPVTNIQNYIEEYDEEACVINLDHDNNQMCDVEVFKTNKDYGGGYTLNDSSCKKCKF